MIESVSLFLRLFAWIYREPYVQTTPNFLRTLPMAVVRSFSGGVVMYFRFCGRRHVFR